MSDNDCYVYNIHDTEFSFDVHVPANGDLRNLTAPWHAGFILTVLEYIKRSPCPSRSIAKLYCHFRSNEYQELFPDSKVADDKAVIDALYPQVNYGTKYYKCIVRQLARLEFAKRINPQSNDP
jgi:hypothetical protein